jgi:predicted permease
MKQHLGQIVERLQHVPGIQSVTLTEHSPDTGGVGSFFCRTTGAMSTNIQVWGNTVGTDYFRTMKVPLVRGRDFAAEDKRGVPVVIVNETLARRFWPEENPIGKRLGIFATAGLAEEWAEVIGVAHDAKYLSLEEPQRLYLYLPYCQQPRSSMTLLVRVKRDWPEAIPHLRRELLAMDAELPVYDLKPLKDGLAVWFIGRTLLASVVGTLGVLGLLLASLGLYGVVAYHVSRRTKEIGIRMALGAERASIIGLVMRQGLYLVLIGTGLGLGVAVITTRLIARLLFGISPLDPVAFVGVTLLMTGVALLACYFPARRTTHLDPMIALRYE